MEESANQLSSSNDKKSYWSSKISLWKASGLTQRAYCERENLRMTSFTYWRSRLKLAKQKSPEKPALVPVSVMPSGIPSSKQMIIVKLSNGSVLEFPSPLSNEQLQTLLLSVGRLR